MRFFGVACVKNEADLIEAFVRHNLVYLERLILLDHGSTDGTSAILQALREEGLPLEIVSDDGIGKLQGARMTGLMREAARQGADWVFLLDADEFIRPRGGVLPESPRDAPPVLKLAWPTHLVHGSDDAGEANPVLRLRHRLANEPLESAALWDRRHLLKAVVRADVAADPRSVVRQGNHEVVIEGSEPEHALWEGVALAHFPLRSPGQYAAKILTHLLQHLAQGSMQEPFSWFYLRHAERIRADYAGFVRDFPELLPAYLETRGHAAARVEDPLDYRGGVLRHTPFCEDVQRLVGNLCGLAEALARAHARLALGAGSGEAPGVILDIGAGHGSQAAAVRAVLHPDRWTEVAVDLPAWAGELPLIVGWGGPVSLVHCAWLRLEADDGGVRQWGGPDMLKDWRVRGNLHPVRDGVCLAFVKGMARAEISLEAPGLEAPVRRVVLALRGDGNPAMIGLRYFQQDPFEAEARQLEIIRGLEAKINRLVRVRGFLEHQAAWLAGLLRGRGRGA